jgi:Sulfotransferase domain
MGVRGVSLGAIEGTRACASPTLPKFFVIGPPRTGTSWLHEVLREHTHLPSPAKETRFFDTHFERGISWYQAHYRNLGSDRPVGEIAPTYFASAEARKRIAQLIPDAKTVCIFRNPVERMLSLYRLKRAYGMIRWNLEEAIVKDPELTESSKYATNFKEWQRDLGADRVLATFYDDLRENPQAYIDTLADFIGIPRFTLSRRDIRHVHASKTMTHPRNYYWTRSATTIADWCKAWRLHTVVAQVKKSPFLGLFLGGGREFSDLSEELSRSIFELCRSEIEDLEVLLKRDLSAWKCYDNVNFSEIDGPGLVRSA